MSRAQSDEHVTLCDVPGDVSIVGFDDIHSLRFFTVPLTTVRGDMSLIGQMPIESLVTLIQAQDMPVLQRRLHVRASTRRLD